jgi:hypothetical protein
MKPPVKPKSYPVSQDEIEGMNAMADSMDTQEAARKAKAATSAASAPKPRPKPTPEDQMPIEARELMRQKAKDAAYNESAKERSLGNMFAKGGMVKSSASKRADGCAVKGKTKGKFV